MTTDAVDRIRALRLTTEEAEEAVEAIHIYNKGNPADASWAGADAQFDKLLKGLADWITDAVMTTDISGYSILQVLNEALAPAGDESDSQRHGNQ